MPTFKQARTYHEDGYGIVNELLVVSDTYAGLFDIDDATETHVILFEASQDDLETGAAAFAVEKADFSLLPAWSVGADDDDCVAFVLQARLSASDPTKKRFIGRLRNWSTPVERADFDFLGVILPQASGDWLRIKGGQWSSTVQPLYAWRMSAQSFDVREMLGAKVKDVVAAIPQSWHDANVADRLGWYYWQPASFAYEGRYCNLVALTTLIQRLLDGAAPAGMTITYESTLLDVKVRPARWQTYRATNGTWTRYSGRYLGGLGSPPAPYKVIVPDNLFQLQAGGDPSADHSIWISSRVISPTPGHEDQSWLRYETIGDLMYALAKAFGAYVQFIYDSSTAIRVRFGPRSEMDTGSCIIRDVTKGSLDSKAVSPESQSERLVGAAWEYSNEGEAQYNYDGAGFRPAEARFAPPTEGERLAVTISPTFCYLENRGYDLLVDISDEPIRSAMIPHNASFYEGGIRKGPEVPEWFTEGNHDALYARITGGPDSTGTYGIEGRTVYMPLGYLHAELDGVEIGTDKLSQYLNALYKRDQSYYDETIDMEVPFICSFRAVEDGPMDWRHCRIGKRVIIDGDEWSIISVRRQSFPKLQTRLRLQRASRFATGVPTTTSETELGGGRGTQTPSKIGRQVLFGTPIAGEDIWAGDLLVLREDGKIYRWTAFHTDFDRVYGISLEDVAEGLPVQAQTKGRVTLPQSVVDAIAMEAGKRVYGRTATGTGPNLSHTRLTGSTSMEDLFLDVGMAETATGVLSLDLRRQFVFQPLIPDLV